MTCDGRSDELAAELEIPVRRGEAGNLPLMSPPGGALHETRDRYSGGPYGLESTPSIDTGSTRLVAVTGNESLCGTGASPVTIGQRPGLERLRIPRGPLGVQLTLCAAHRLADRTLAGWPRQAHLTPACGPTGSGAAGYRRRS